MLINYIICVFLLIKIKCDIYFPKLYLNGHYMATNFGEFQSEHPRSKSNDQGVVVKWYVRNINKLLLAEIVNYNSTIIKSTESSVLGNCYVLIYDFNNYGKNCKLGQNNIMINDFYTVIVLNCDINQTFIFLVNPLIDNCVYIPLQNFTCKKIIKLIFFRSKKV